MSSVRPGCHLSVVIPFYEAEACLAELHRRLVKTLERVSPDFEIVLVEDGGQDASWAGIEALAMSDPRVRAIKLSRNFGQHYAITAGLDVARGEWVVVMDCDLQDQPEEIEKLYHKALEGFDVVVARRLVRHDPLGRRLSSRLFTLLYSYLGDLEADSAIANFSISSHEVIANIRRFRERDRSFPVFLANVGFRRATVEVEHAERYAGRSSYSFGKLLDFAIQCIVSQSNKPLRLSIRFGFLLAALSIIYGAAIVFRYLRHGIDVPGWTTVVVLVSFLGGLGFANLGILGLYLGKVFDEVKRRPLYCIEQRLNLEEATEGEDRP